MASFATMEAASTRCKAQMASKVWVVATQPKTSTGTSSNPGAGGWVETTDDTVS
jgi:hypothetical protein